MAKDPRDRSTLDMFAEEEIQELALRHKYLHEVSRKRELSQEEILQKKQVWNKLRRLTNGH